MKYEPKASEQKWQDKWYNSDLYHAVDFDSKPKKYVLTEFPYPSGSGLHIGHAFSFTGGDVFARYWRMRGYNVLFPMGWDAFGLPTENYAIKMKRKPQDVTKENTDMFRSQMKNLGFSYDWSREVNTTDPSYYKWTQWIFIKLFEKGLAVKKEMPINWCPSCKTGLANEEVIDGKCERCGAETTKRNMSQWIYRIPEYADRLIEGLKHTSFIEKVKTAQINWIGKSEGGKVTFKVDGDNLSVKELEVFTTRPDTLWGVTFMVIAPEHPLVAEFSRPEVKEYVAASKKKSFIERGDVSKEKSGVYSGVDMINPVNGKKIQLWVADYVLMDYGTGVVMGVPAHDQRDWDFATKYGMDIIPVIKTAQEWEYKKAAMTDVEEGEMINSDVITGLQVKDAIAKVVEWLEKEGIGGKANSYHLRDWIFSRQHYWGEPIPLVKCEKCGWVTVPEDQLPIKLPDVEHYEPTDTGESPLSVMTDWVNTTCPKCGGPAKRETDTMPNWAGSNWYFVRYTDPFNGEVIADKEKMKYWMPVDMYIGGDEHTTLHLLYSRFIYQVLYDLGYMVTPEPYDTRMSHGVILGPDNQRMSKSRGNVIVPEDITSKVGADATRAYLMFMGPFDGTMAWNDKALMGVKRFADRFYSYIVENKEKFGKTDDKEVAVQINKTIKHVTIGMENFQFNTSIAKMMELLNSLEKTAPEKLSIESAKAVVKLLAPFMPFMTEDIWEALAESGSIHAAPWPKYDESMMVVDEIEVAVQVNGKVRGKVVVGVNEPEESIKQKVMESEELKRFFDGVQLKKFIYVKGRIVNLVVG